MVAMPLAISKIEFLINYPHFNSFLVGTMQIS